MSLARKQLSLTDLATAKGALKLQKALGGRDEDFARMMVLSNKYLKDNPDLAAISVGISDGGSYYDHDNRRIGLSVSSPDILSHELGHALDFSKNTSLYNQVVTPYSKKINRFLDRVALPSAVGITLANIDNSTKQKMFNVAKGVALASALPNLYNEMRATHLASAKAPSYARSLGALSPGLLSHGINDLSPLAKLMAVDYIRKDNELRHAAAAAVNSHF